MADILQEMHALYDMLTLWNNMVPPSVFARGDSAIVTLEKGWQFIFLAEDCNFAVQPVDGMGNRGEVHILKADDTDRLQKLLEELNV